MTHAFPTRRSSDLRPRGDRDQRPEPYDHRTGRLDHTGHRGPLVRGPGCPPRVDDTRPADPRGRLPAGHRAGVQAVSTEQDIFTPDPGSAPLARQVRAQAWMETKLTLRHGEPPLLAGVMPVLALVAGVLAAGRIGPGVGRPVSRASVWQEVGRM